MKTKTALLILFVIASATAFTQKISNINFDSIQVRINDATSDHYYPKLLDRFNKADTTLTDAHFESIYYGSVFFENYSPYGHPDEDKFYEFYKKKEYAKAIPFGEKVLRGDPVNLKINFKMLVCHNTLGEKSKADYYAMRYYRMLNTIYGSGTGISVDSAFVVVKVSDEYEILADLELQMTSQALQGDTDILTLDTKSQKQEPKINELFFNVSKPFDYLQKQFRKKK